MGLVNQGRSGSGAELAAGAGAAFVDSFANVRALFLAAEPELR